MSQRSKHNDDDNDELNFGDTSVSEDDSNLTDAFDARTVVVSQPSRLPPTHPNVSPTVPKHVLESMPPLPEFSMDGDDDESDEDISEKTQYVPSKNPPKAEAKPKAVLDDNFDARTMVQVKKPVAAAPPPPPPEPVKLAPPKPSPKVEVKSEPKADAAKLQRLYEDTNPGEELSLEEDDSDERPSAFLILRERAGMALRSVPKAGWAGVAIVAIGVMYFVFKGPSAPSRSEPKVATQEVEPAVVAQNVPPQPAGSSTDSLLALFDDSFNRTQALIRKDQ